MTDTTVPDLQSKYNELVNTPEIVEMNKTLISKEEEIKNLQLELDNLEDSFEKQYPNATTGVLASRVADARASMNKDINTKINSYNATASMINSLKATGEAQYNTYKDQYELEVSQRNQRMSEL